MTKLLLIGLGGGIGAVARFLLSGCLQTPESTFPWGTLIVNLVGCFCLGLLIRFVGPGTHLHLWLAVGILASFTTFSTFSLETLQMIQNHRLGAMAGYVLASMAGGIGFAALGYWTARLFQG